MSELCEGLQKSPKDYDVLCGMTDKKNRSFVEANVTACAQEIEDTKFFQWLNNPLKVNKKHHAPKVFSTMKEKWIDKEVIKPNECMPVTFDELANKYFLELTCAGIVKYFISNVHMVQKFSSAYDGYNDINEAIDVIYKKYSTVLVVENVAQQLLLASLDFLRKQDGIKSPFFSQKGGKFLARRSLIKMTLYFLYLRSISDFFLGKPYKIPLYCIV